MPCARAARDLDACRPRHRPALDAPAPRVVPDERSGVRRGLLHQVLRVGVGLRGAPLLECEDVVPVVLLAELHQRGAGVEPVAENAYPKVWKRGLQHGGEAKEAMVLAVLLLVLVPVVPGLDRDGHDGVRRPPGRYELRLEDIPVRAVPEPLAAADALLLRPIHRDDEKSAEPRVVEHLQPHHVRHDVHERLFEDRRASARKVVADAQRAGSGPLLALDPPALPRELVHRARPALVAGPVRLA